MKQSGGGIFDRPFAGHDPVQAMKTQIKRRGDSRVPVLHQGGCEPEVQLRIEFRSSWIAEVGCADLGRIGFGPDDDLAP